MSSNDWPLQNFSFGAEHHSQVLMRRPRGRRTSRMSLFDNLAQYRSIELHAFHDEATGLRAAVAIHSTQLGPAIGGTRMYSYATEDEAILDVCRLARGMTHKA